MRHTLIAFENEDELVRQYKNYLKNKREKSTLVVISVVQALSNVEPFTKGDYILLIQGESWCHKDIHTIETLLHVSGIKKCIDMSSKLYFHLGHGHINDFLLKHFHQLSQDEVDLLVYS